MDIAEIANDLPEPVKIYLYRQAVHWLRSRAQDTDTPIDDIAVDILAKYLADVLGLPTPPNYDDAS